MQPRRCAEIKTAALWETTERYYTRLSKMKRGRKEFENENSIRGLRDGIRDDWNAGVWATEVSAKPHDCVSAGPTTYVRGERFHFGRRSHAGREVFVCSFEWRFQRRAELRLAGEACRVRKPFVLWHDSG